MTATEKQFASADREIAKTADAIAEQVGKLLRATAKYDAVAPDYVLERLLAELLGRHPKFLEWVDRQPGPGTMKLALALNDWLDLWGER